MTLVVEVAGLTVNLPLWLNMKLERSGIRFDIPAVPSASTTPFLSNA